MSVVQIFFIAYFGILAACIVNQFVFCDNVAKEFVTKLLGGMLGASLLLGPGPVRVEGVSFIPGLFGAFAGALVTAVAWKFVANRAAVRPSHGLEHRAVKL